MASDLDWEDTVAADLRALGRQVPTGLNAYEAPDPVETGAPDLPPDEVVDGILETAADLPHADEFVCGRCFLVVHNARRAAGTDHCRDCD